MNRTGITPARSRCCALAALVAYLHPALAGCQPVDIAAKRVESPALDGSVNEATDGALDAQGQACEGQGPRVRLGDNAISTAECKQGEPTRAFIHALCVCADYSASHELITDSFDSSAGSFVTTRAEGSVGVNGDLANNGFVMEIGGSLQVAGATGATLSPGAEVYVNQNLETQGPIQGAQAGVFVSGDGRVGGRIALADLRVGGALTVPNGVNIDVTGSRQIGVLKNEAVSVKPPCGCDAEDLVDIEALVDERRNDNDNAALEFDPAELEDYKGPITRNLPCGRYYLARLSGSGPLTLQVAGRAALYVEKQVNFQGPVLVELDRGADLDVFFADTMVAKDNLVFGSKTGPGRVRLYVGGSGTLELQGENLLSGFIYAPRSELVVNGTTEVFGSIFVQRAAPTKRVTIHYDRNSIEAGQNCRGL